MYKRQVLPLNGFLLVAALLFSTGLAVVMTKRNAVVVLMGVELMLNAANLNLVAFSRHDPALQGQFFSLFVMVVAAAEVAVGLALVLLAFRRYGSILLDELQQLKG